MVAILLNNESYFTKSGQDRGVVKLISYSDGVILYIKMLS